MGLFGKSKDLKEAEKKVKTWQWVTAGTAALFLGALAWALLK